MKASSDSLENLIKAEAKRLGFSFCGITNAAPLNEFSRYDAWISNEYHAGMQFMASERHRKARSDPRLLMPEVQSILCLGWSYPLRSMEEISHSEKALIAGYVSDFDYHQLLPQLMEKIVDFISKRTKRKVIAKGFTDSAPILERELASRAGIGWIGKNSCLISPKFGSAFHLADLFLDIDLKPDPPFLYDYCGSCTRCVDACPTKCILPDRTIDSQKCLSYLTIESKNVLPENLRDLTGPWLFGCDICQMVCPWNRKGITETNFSLLISFSYEQVVNLLRLTPAEFKQQFQHSAMSRVKWKGMIQNAITFLGNSHNPSCLDQIKPFLEQPEFSDNAQWAIDKLTTSNF